MGNKKSERVRTHHRQVRASCPSVLYPPICITFQQLLILNISFSPLPHDFNRTQALYGIIQGGIYEDLRDESTAFINAHAFFGTAIGGSLGATKKEMHDIVAYTRARVRDDRPVHLLGIGGVRDIFHGVRHGIDTFDCVHPSRLGRHGGALGTSTFANILF